MGFRPKNPCRVSTAAPAPVPAPPTPTAGRRRQITGLHAPPGPVQTALHDARTKASPPIDLNFPTTNRPWPWLESIHWTRTRSAHRREPRSPRREQSERADSRVGAEVSPPPCSGALCAPSCGPGKSLDDLDYDRAPLGGHRPLLQILGEDQGEGEPPRNLSISRSRRAVARARRASAAARPYHASFTSSPTAPRSSPRRLSQGTRSLPC